MKDKTESEKEKARCDYCAAGKGLFDDSLIIDLEYKDEKTNADRLLRVLNASIERFKKSEVQAPFFQEEDGEMLAAALTMPTMLTYTDWSKTDEKDGSPKPSECVFVPAEADIVWRVRNAIAAYCLEAAVLARRVHSETAETWSRAHAIIRDNCLEGWAPLLSCKQSDAIWIAKLLVFDDDNVLGTLRTDVQIFRESSRETDGQPAAPTVMAMQPAATVPKRKRRYKRMGNGLKGPLKEKQQEQYDVFQEYLRDHPENADFSRIERAHQCWNLHSTEWERAKTAKGEAKGYSSYKSLAAAKRKPQPPFSPSWGRN